MKAKRTKTLIASISALVICFTMIIGTTFAWFTDSVVNTNNIIKSGNVDVELYHKSNSAGEFEEVNSETKLFVNKEGKEIVWEPGASTTEEFQIVNAGTLALKYKFSVKALAKELNADGNSLLDVITVTAMLGEEEKEVSFGEEFTGIITAGAPAKEYKINLKWNNQQGDKDNAYEELKLVLGVELLATQVYSEQDGTGTGFDDGIEFTNTSNEIDISGDVAEDVTLATKGENAVKVSLPSELVNGLSASKISLVHTEPKVEGDKVIFDAIELVDEKGDIIDLSNNEKEITITLPSQTKFNSGKSVEIYHDGEFVDWTTVKENGAIEYTANHLCLVVVEPAWDGTADTTWYNETDTEFSLATASELAGLTELVDGGNTFEGKTIKLSSDINLGSKGTDGELISFNPIGYGYDIVFKGTFDGQGHTISNLYQNGWALGYSYGTQGGGLFASVVDATIKNLTIDGAEIVMECVDMGVLVGYSYGSCTYENINISNSTIANYQRYTGGVVGEVNGIQTFKNVDVASDVVVSSLWGDFDCSLGGIVGGKYGNATLTFEDCDVACALNTYNDVTSSYQWYAYRRAGMLIGNSEETVKEDERTSATASYLTATNCTVTYGDWANYTYCEFAGTSWPYVRVQEGYSNSAYSNPRYGVAKDANGNTVIDNNHVHGEGEDHNILLAFDQLFGGGQGVYGTATHDGVKVIYNNK